MINYDSERGISVTTTPGRRTHSQLSIKKADVSDSGNYTCAPSSALPASIHVFVSGRIRYFEDAIVFFVKKFVKHFNLNLIWIWFHITGSEVKPWTSGANGSTSRAELLYLLAMLLFANIAGFILIPKPFWSQSLWSPVIVNTNSWATSWLLF